MSRILIVGAGLSGLTTAWKLHQNGHPFQLIEARPRVGGRILSTNPTDGSASLAAASVDLGPSWFWPGQNRLAKLIQELDLQEQVFEQPWQGQSLIEMSEGQIERRSGGASMQGSYRLNGGISTLTNALRERLPDESIQLNTILKSITDSGNTLTCQTSDNRHKGGDQEIIKIEVEKVVLAMPPRLVSQLVRFSPELATQVLDNWLRTPTWMAGQAKFVAIYKEAFWQQTGLSGDAFSQIGPLTEIHDASPANGDHAALFGFVGVPADIRETRSNDISAAALEQLERLFGVKAKEALHVSLMDWATEAFTSTAEDSNAAYPQHATIEFPPTLWNDRIIWAGTETASHNQHSNGYLEGAVESADRASGYFTNN